MRENAFIHNVLKPLAVNDYALGLQDDAALLEIPPLHQLVVTTDMLQEGIHFLSDGHPADIAWKAMAANLSDLAAMGAAPHSYQLALGLSETQDSAWLQAFCEGLQAVQAQFGIGLSGGDTIRGCAALTISITAHGLVPMGQALRRTHAKVGDALYVTGTLGDAALGLALLQGKISDLPTSLAEFVIQRYWRPMPRLEAGVALRGIATACMDISDGLLVDCAKLCAASSVGAVIDYDALPLSEAGRYVQDRHPELFAACISAGDDYELLVSASDLEGIDSLVMKDGTPLTRIGTITEAGNGVQLLHADGTPVILPYAGYEH
jgi:thiamine-monophosphate kinase